MVLKTAKVDKESILSLLKEMVLLLKLNQENVFKIRAFERAREILKSNSEDWVSQIPVGTLIEIKGIGKGINGVVTDFYQTGQSEEKERLESNLPRGLLEIIKVPGLGPKRACQLVEELGVRSVGELEYACRENRLLGLKGFGKKAQEKILESIEFLKSTQGLRRWVDVQKPYKEILDGLRNTLKQKIRVEGVGEFSRRMETIECVEFLVEAKIKDRPMLEKKLKLVVQKQTKKSGIDLEVKLHFSDPSEFGYEQVRLISSREHWKKIGNPKKFKANTEKDFYSKINLPWIPAEMRETGDEVAFVKSKKFEQLLGWNDLKGVFHNHTTWSDGAATLEQMVKRSIELGYQYIGISDHSQSAFYAHGLKEQAVNAQEKEIKKLQGKYPEIRIFWGIESDILKDGNLDYPDRILKKFDFVIASIHQRFKADRKTMTKRILKAIRNPYTRFIGHVSGRLILGRPPYDVDMELLIKEAARCNTAIEINANPWRLDIDWRYGKTMRSSKMLTSINPDAHHLPGLEDGIHGIGVARKAMLIRDQVINSWETKDVETWLSQRN